RKRKRRTFAHSVADASGSWGEAVTMDLALKGQVAVIAGAAQGIGRAIADAFAAEGAGVALIDRDRSVHDAAKAIGQQHGVAYLSAEADVTDFGGVTDAARAALSKLGRIDHVVFAVGVGSGKFGFPFWNLTPDDWPRVLMVNVVGAANVAHAFAPALVAQRSGTMLFLGGVAGPIGSPTDSP